MEITKKLCYSGTYAIGLFFACSILHQLFFHTVDVLLITIWCIAQAMGCFTASLRIEKQVHERKKFFITILILVGLLVILFFLPYFLQQKWILFLIEMTISYILGIFNLSIFIHYFKNSHNKSNVKS